jgi:hypothetical protein
VIELHRAMFFDETQLRDRSHGFCTHEKFFLFVVGRNSTGIALPRPRKSFAAWQLESWDRAKLPEFCTGGWCKIVAGEAKFVTGAIADLECWNAE